MVRALQLLVLAAVLQEAALASWQLVFARGNKTASMVALQA
jgi:hypothetical protein